MENPVSPEQRRSNWIQRIFGKKVLSIQQRAVVVPLSIPQPEIIQPTIKTEETETPKTEERQLNIGTHFLELLKEKGAIIPKEERFDSSLGAPAMPGEGTNETLDPNLVEKVHTQKEAPNGYLIGVGAGNVMSMLELFPEGQMPKAMILFDINPSVVSEGKYLIELLKNEPNPANNSRTRKLVTCVEGLEKEEKVLFMLKQLATEGNLAIERADFTDQRVVDALNQLPDVHNSNNVVYLSNISDHMHRNKSRLRSKKDYVPDFNFLEALKPQPPQKNYYVDTLQGNLGYKIRIGTYVPQFIKGDFKLGDGAQTKPTDEIDGPIQNPAYEDITGWETQEIIDTYRKFASTPQQQKRANLIEQKINSDRKKALEKYEDWKKKTNEPTQETAGTKYKYAVPTDPTEEDKVKKELALPYNYERDFIPFIAKDVWRNAISPQNLSIEQQGSGFDKDGPSVSVFEYHSSGYNHYYLHDPREQMKGHVERVHLQTLPYEELVMAKLYREIQVRVSKRPNFDPNNKDFNELVNELRS